MAIMSAIQNKFKNTRLLFILSIIAVVLLVALIWWIIDLTSHVETDDSFITGHLHPVSPRVSGTITGVYFDDNQIVKAGQLLVTLDPRDFQVAVQQAKAALTNAKAQAKAAEANVTLSRGQYQGQVTQARGELSASSEVVGQTQSSLRAAQAAVETARQNLAQSQASLTKAQQDVQRYSTVDPRAVSAQIRDEAQTTYEGALATRNASQASVAQAMARVSEIRREISANRARVIQSQGVLQTAKSQTYQVNVQKSQAQSARATVGEAQAELKQAQLNLSYTRIVAPVSGKVGKKNAEVGQRIQPGQPLLSIVDPRVWVVANLKETQLENVRPGEAVHIHVDAFPHHPFRGVVESISPASGAQFALLPPDNATGNFTKIVQRIPVKILFTVESIEGYENLLAPGMSTVIKINVRSAKREKRRHRS